MCTHCTLYRKLCQQDASKFHLQLCIALFYMLIVFVVGIDKTSMYGGCLTVSVLIHYFALVSVMWIGAEAVLMFQELVIVFGQTTTRFIVAVSLVCWCKFLSVNCFTTVAICMGTRFDFGPEGSRYECANAWWLKSYPSRFSYHCKNIWVTETIFWSSQLHSYLLCAWHITNFKGMLAICLGVVEKAPSIRIFLQKAYSYLVTLLAFLPQPCNQGTPPGADVQDQRNTDLTRNAISLLKGNTNLTKGEASQLHFDSEWDW